MPTRYSPHWCGQRVTAMRPNPTDPIYRRDYRVLDLGLIDDGRAWRVLDGVVRDSVVVSVVRQLSQCG
jgi:hypothetical protein